MTRRGGSPGELMSVGSCPKCGRRDGDHTYFCITKEYIQTRDPQCGCDYCHGIVDGKRVYLYPSMLAIDQKGLP